VKTAFFHNLPSGGALKMLTGAIQCLETQGHSTQVYSFSTADHSFASGYGKSSAIIESFNYSGLGKVARYMKATREIANRINASNADLVWVDKCRYFGSPPLLQFLTRPYFFMRMSLFVFGSMNFWLGAAAKKRL